MQFRAVTLNVWGLPFGLARETPGRMRAIGNHFQALEADLIALQEVWTADSREILLDAAHEAGFPQTWHRPQNFGGSGLFLASRWPLESVIFTPFVAAGLPQRIHHADFWGGKGFVQARVQTPAGPIRCVATHLHASYVEPGAADEYVDVRIAQVTQMARALDGHEEPLILMGDLNLREDEPEYIVLRGLTGLDDVADLTSTRSLTLPAGGPYRDGSESAQRIDYVMLRSGTHQKITADRLRLVFDAPPPEVSDPSGYSDHVGLLAELTLEANPSAARAAPSIDDTTLREAREHLHRGRDLGRKRQGREWRAALGLGLIALGCAAGAVVSPNPWLKIGSGLLSALFAVLSVGFAALCSWGGRHEAHGYHCAENDLDALQTMRPQRDTFRAP